MHEKENVIQFVYNLETCGGPGDINGSNNNTTITTTTTNSNNNYNNNLETCGGPGDIEESLSMREGSRGTVAWIQQKASIASVFTPDLQSMMLK